MSHANHANQDCVICMSEMKPDKNEIKNTHCNHMFHRACLTSWLINHTTCPLCRGDIMEEREVARNLEADFDDATDEFSHVAEMYDHDNLVHERINHDFSDDIADEFSHVAEMYDHIVNERIIYDFFDDGRFFLIDATAEDIDFINSWNELNPSYVVTMVEQ